MKSKKPVKKDLVIVTVLTALLVLFSRKSVGAEIELPSKATLKVLYSAAKRYDVDAQSLIKIAFVESSFRADARRVNVNGTVDYGMFQVNSIHWSTTCKKFNIFELKGNALCAAKILARFKKHADTDLHWQGRYHSSTPKRKIAYALKLASIDFKGIK